MKINEKRKIYNIQKYYNNMKSKENLYGAWMVLIGVVTAIILGVFQKYILASYNVWIFILLAVLGIIIGIVSVSEDSKGAVTFLFATLCLVIVSSEGQQRLIIIGEVGLLMIAILNALLIMFIPATIVVALKTLFSIASIK